MHARKNRRSSKKLSERTNLLEGNYAHTENQLLSQANDRPTFNLGDPQQQLIVSMESFFDFNFELSKSLEIMVEGKLLSENQKRWNGHSRHELRKNTVVYQPLDPKTVENGNMIPKTPK